MSIARRALLALPRASTSSASSHPQQRFSSSESHGHEDHHDHHDADTTVYPKEPGRSTNTVPNCGLIHGCIGFGTAPWRNTLAFAALAVVAYKYAPEKGEDNFITQWMATYNASRERLLEINAKHTALSSQMSTDVLFFKSAEKPVMHRYRFPQ